MRNTLFASSLVFFCLISFGFTTLPQDSEWFEFDMDELVTFEMPFEEIGEKDTLLNGRRYYYLIGDNNGTRFIAQKTQLVESNEDEMQAGLPFNKLSLRKYYKDFAEGMRKGTDGVKEDNYEIEKNGLLGRHVLVFDAEGKVIYEEEIILLNQYAYSFAYTSENNFDPFERDGFLESWRINEEAEITQYSEKSGIVNIVRGISKIVFSVLGGAAMILIALKMTKTI